MNIFQYTDYRLYLKAYYEKMKKSKPYFSYRYFSKLADVTAPNFLYLIIKGERNLTKRSLVKVAKALSLLGDELSYFENMVFYTQAKSIDEKNFFYSNMLQLKESAPIKEISEEQIEYLKEWYYCAVRELVTMYNFNGDYTALSKKLTPNITPGEAKKAIDLLLKLELIKEDEEGNFTQTDNSLFMCQNGFTALLLEEFHNNMMQKAIDSNKKTARKERLVASTTFSISKKTFEFFVKRTREFRRELQEVARLDDNPEQVYEFVFNLFPLSEDINKDSH